VSATLGMPLDLAGAVEGSGGHFRGELSPEWEIWGPNGGYIASLALRAAGEVAAIRRPASISCHFLRAARSGPVDLETTVLQSGRRAESIAVQILQQGRTVSTAIVRMAAPAPGYELQRLAAPAAPPPDELEADETGPYPFWSNVERRPLPRDEEENGRREWVRFRPAGTFDDPFVDASRLLILMDAFTWPAFFGRVGQGGEFIAPSLDITAWFHRNAEASEWLLVDSTCSHGADGLLGIQEHVWGETGELHASGGAQLCCIPSP
jgi:acyl-CoA thioesterase-2